MNNEPDLSFDIEALFEHMGVEEGVKAELSDWHFRITSPDLDKLETVAEEQKKYFDVHLQEEVEIINADDNSVTMGDPMLTLIQRGEFAYGEVKDLVSRVSKIAEENGVKYDGVDSYDPIDAEEIFGWIPVEDAGWRLRHMTDCGLDEDGELPWTFYIETSNSEINKKVKDKLEAGGFDDLELFDEPDEEGFCAICIFVEGRNNEIELIQMAEKIEEFANPFDAKLQGIQFYDRETFAEVFLGDEIDN